MDTIKMKQKIIEVIDLTSLSDEDTSLSTQSLCKEVTTPWGEVAAVCVLPPFVSKAREDLSSTNVKVATVANFPSGTSTFKTVIDAIAVNVEQGADEIDVVVPYQAYLNGERESVNQFVQRCKLTCGDRILKIILETGKFSAVSDIYQLSLCALQSGADFIKTSTGRISVGATEQAVTAMLLAIKQHLAQSGQLKGLKVSGGIRQVNQAQAFMELCVTEFGWEYISPKTFRIGASSLLSVLKQH